MWVGRPPRARVTSPASSVSRARRSGVSGLSCKHCGSGSFVRNGMAHGRQRYRCKACGRSFTATPPRGKPPAMKALAVLLYALGGVSQGMIARLLGVSHVAVYKWVRAAGEAAPTPPTASSEGVVQIDEMWHFVNGKKTRWLLSGFGVVRIGRRDQAGDEGAEERLPAAPGVVDELEEAEIGGQLLPRDAPVRPQPGAQQGPEALGRVDVDLAEPVAILVAGVLSPPVADGLVPVAPMS